MNNSIGYIVPANNLIFRSCDEIKKGALTIAEGISNKLYDIYDLKNDGFEKWVKAFPPTLKLISLMSGKSDLFDCSIAITKEQKDLYYATKFTVSIANFVEGKHSKKVWHERLALYLCDIGNFFDTALFLKKNEVFEMKWASRFAKKFGSIRVFSSLEKLSGWKTFAEVPVLGNIATSPKDLFVFTSSLIHVGSMLYRTIYIMEGGDLYQAAEARRDYVFNWSNLLKFSANLGKMILIACNRSYSGANWFLCVDFCTQWAGLLSHWNRRSVEREKRHCHPAAAETSARA